MSSTVRMICPNLRCRSILSVPPEARGKTVLCRQCAMRIHVPKSRQQAGPASSNASKPDAA